MSETERKLREALMAVVSDPRIYNLCGWYEPMVAAREALDALPSDGWRTMESAAARDVLAECERQKSVEGWTDEHDDGHVHEELARAAAFYAMPDRFDGFDDLWPWDWEWFKPGPRRRDLVKAGALILKERELYR